MRRIQKCDLQLQGLIYEHKRHRQFEIKLVQVQTYLDLKRSRQPDSLLQKEINFGSISRNLSGTEEDCPQITANSTQITQYTNVIPILHPFTNISLNLKQLYFKGSFLKVCFCNLKPWKKQLRANIRRINIIHHN